MSRIDKAIEKIAKLRDGAPAPQESVVVSQPPALPDIKGLMGTKPLNVKNPSLVALHRNNPKACEEYAKLKSELLRMTSQDKFHNALIVTSTLRGEGKTLTALNLAITLAQEYDHTVLLVDADLRNPSIHKYLGFEPKVGLGDCLRGRVDIEEALVKTGIGKLVVLPGVGVVEDPVELLSSKKMKTVLEELKNRYPDRYVIFDMPPALNFADAQVLGASVDGVLFVVREGMAKVAQIKKALSHLRDTKVLGTVYNECSAIVANDSDYLY